MGVKKFRLSIEGISKKSTHNSFAYRELQVPEAEYWFGPALGNGVVPYNGNDFINVSELYSYGALSKREQFMVANNERYLNFPELRGDYANFSNINKFGDSDAEDATFGRFFVQQRNLMFVVFDTYERFENTIRFGDIMIEPPYGSRPQPDLQHIRELHIPKINLRKPFRLMFDMRVDIEVEDERMFREETYITGFILGQVNFDFTFIKESGTDQPYIRIRDNKYHSTIMPLKSNSKTINNIRTEQFTVCFEYFGYNCRYMQPTIFSTNKEKVLTSTIWSASEYALNSFLKYSANKAPSLGTDQKLIFGCVDVPPRPYSHIPKTTIDNIYLACCVLDS